MGIIRRAGEVVLDKALSLVTEQVLVDSAGNIIKPRKKRNTRPIRYDKATGEINIRLKAPSPSNSPASAPPPRPVRERYYAPRFTSRMPRITPKRPKLRL